MDRATYLTQSAYRLLDDWGANLCRTFPGHVPYLVGSALTRPDYRDVDVRLMLWDDAYVRLCRVVVERQHYDNNGGKGHSRKPPGLVDLVLEASPGPYLELFSRTPPLGWDSWGDGYEIGAAS